MDLNISAERKIIIAGTGGQGIVFLTRLISQTAVDLGYPVLVSETHGMSQRGGSVISHVKINGDEAPLVQRGTADLLIAMDPNEAMQNLNYVRHGGTVIVNTSEGLHPDLKPHLERLDIKVIKFSAGKIAVELGSPATANVVMVGFVVAHSMLPFPLEKVRETVEQVSKSGTKVNLQALEAGLEAGRKQLESLGALRGKPS